MGAEQHTWIAACLVPRGEERIAKRHSPLTARDLERLAASCSEEVLDEDIDIAHVTHALAQIVPAETGIPCTAKTAKCTVKTQFQHLRLQALTTMIGRLQDACPRG
jgi:hypothetical protein